MGDLITIDAARAAEIAALAVPALTAELAALNKASLELVLETENAKGGDARTTAVAAITAAIDAIDKAEADAAAAAVEAEAKAAAEAAAAKEAEELAAREKAEAEQKAADDAKAAAEAEASAPVEPVVYDGHTEMRNADGSGCSWRGTSYEPDADGVVTVPVAACADLLDHGFSYVAAKG
jgi:membrane protein involved in colicin uptake